MSGTADIPSVTWIWWVLASSSSRRRNGRSVTASPSSVADNTPTDTPLGFSTLISYRAAPYRTVISGYPKRVRAERHSRQRHLARRNRHCGRPGHDRHPEGRAFVEGLHALKRIATPEEIAKSVLYLASDASSFTTGTA